MSNLKSEVLDGGNKLSNALNRIGVSVNFGKKSEGNTDLGELIDLAVENIGGGTNYDLTVTETDILTFDGDYEVSAILTENEEPSINKVVLLYNVDDDTEYYYGYTDSNGEIVFELTTDSQNKEFIINTVGIGEVINVTYCKYNVINDVGVLSTDGTATITATVKDFNTPIENGKVNLLLNNSIVDTDYTDSSGVIEFDVTVTGTTRYVIQFVDEENNITINKDFGVEYNPQKSYTFKFDGTENVYNIDATGISVDNGVLTGGNGYITDVYLDNSYDWEFECVVNISDLYTGFILIEESTVRDKGGIYIFRDRDNFKFNIRYPDGYVLHNVIINDYMSFDTDHLVNIKRIGQDIILTIDGVEVSTNNDYRNFAIQNLYLGLTAWNNKFDKTVVSNAKFKSYYETKNHIYELIYSPTLNGTEQLTQIRNHLPLIRNNELDTLWDFGGYLTDAFLNYPNWKVEVDVKQGNNNRNCAIEIIKNGTTSQDIDRIFYGDSNNFEIREGGTRRQDNYMNNNALTTEYQTVTFTKISDYVITNTIEGSTKTGRLRANFLPSSTSLGVGLRSWNNNSTVQIKNIKVYKGMEDIVDDG